jgi:hypothetical protein
MLKCQTTAEYRNMLRDLSTADLLTLSEVYQGPVGTGVSDRVYQELIDAEVERRIANWEVATA